MSKRPMRHPRAASGSARSAQDRYWGTRLVLEYLRLAADLLIRTAGETARTFWIR